MSGLTPPQYYTLVIAANCSSCISIVGSSIIINIAKNKFKDRLYHRILLLISISDVGFSLTNILHPFLLPSGTDGLLWASGNTASCSAMGFFIVVFPLMTSMFNAYLSLSFMFTVRYDWREYQFSNYEKPCYIFVVILPLSIGISGLVLEAYNPSRLAHICYFNDYPQDCSDDPAVDCIRGEKGDVVGWVGIACLMVAALVGFFGTISVYITVRKKTRKANRRSLELQGPRLSNNLRRDRLRKEQAVAMQAVLYSLVYLNSFIWPFLVFAINESVDTQGREGEPGLFTLQLLAWILFPLQGGFNCIVYLNPQWRRWRAIHPSASKMTTAWNVVKGESPLEARKNRAREEGNHIAGEAEATTAAATPMQSSTRQSSRMLFDGSWFFTSFKRLSKRISRRSSDGRPSESEIVESRVHTEDLPKFTSYAPKSARSKPIQNDEKDNSMESNNNIIIPAATVDEEDTRRRSLLDDEALW